jgi:pilus assembly protein CpaC
MTLKSHRKLFLSLLATLLTFMFVSVSLAAEIERQTFATKLGGSELVRTKYPFKRVTIADPKIADVVVLSPRDLYVYGKNVGYTSIILWKENVGKTLLDVTVTLDLTGLKERIAALYPEQDIKVHGSETGIVLSGTVSGPEVVDQVLRLSQTYLPRQGSGKRGEEGSGKSGFGVTNLLKVTGLQQVMLEVKFAEVSRSHGKDWSVSGAVNQIDTAFAGVVGLANLGINSAGALGTATTGSVLVNFLNDGTSSNGNRANIFGSFDNGEVIAALEFLETEGLARTLAEPRLVTMSGQEASFLAGGELPIPVAQEDNTTTIEFKEFGVGLVFTPVVLSDGRISLRVNPSVTQLADQAIELTSGSISYSIPGLTTRKLETMVQLQDGQTLALAGLLQDNVRETVKKIPGLGNLPIIGPLFSSTGYQQEKTDLLIAVTPHLVKPNPEGTIRFPGEDFRPPDWYEFYIERRLEGRRVKDKLPIDAHPFTPGVTDPADEPGSPEVAGGLEGKFGHQPFGTL